MDLRWRHVETALIKLLGIEEKQMGAFRARLRHLKAVGVPLIDKVGSGTQIIYTREQVADLYLALLVMRFGVTPKAASWLITELHDEEHHPGSMNLDIEGDFFFVLFPDNDQNPWTYSIRGIEQLKASMSFEDTPAAQMDPPEAINQVAWKAFNVINVSKCLRAVDFVLKN